MTNIQKLQKLIETVDFSGIQKFYEEPSDEEVAEFFEYVGEIEDSQLDEKYYDEMAEYFGQLEQEQE